MSSPSLQRNWRCLEYWGGSAERGMVFPLVPLTPALSLWEREFLRSDVAHGYRYIRLKRRDQGIAIIVGCLYGAVTMQHLPQCSIPL
jgi:hypothetical protein